MSCFCDNEEKNLFAYLKENLSWLCPCELNVQLNCPCECAVVDYIAFSKSLLLLLKIIA